MIDLETEIEALLSDSDSPPSEALADYAAENGWIGVQHRNLLLNSLGSRASTEEMRQVMRGIHFHILRAYLLERMMGQNSRTSAQEPAGAPESNPRPSAQSIRLQPPAATSVTGNHLAPTSAILGVFAYLDQVLPAAMRERFVTEDIGVCPVVWPAQTHELREQGRSLISDAFPLKNEHAPLCQELESFRLYHSWDKADALIAAYGLRARGLDPMPALQADYAIRSGGILRWADVEKMQAEAEKDPQHVYRRIHPFTKEGDRIVHYSLPTELGLMLVRGDRLVCKVSTLHMSIERDSGDHSKKLMADWEAVGGYKAFFASPPPRAR